MEETADLYECYRWYYRMKTGIIAPCLQRWLSKPAGGIGLHRVALPRASVSG